MTEEERVRAIAREAAHEAVEETLRRIGVDPDDEWREVQQDLNYLRRLRSGADQAAAWVRKGAITTAAGGIMWAVWEAIRAGGGR